jgi:hypothetical protein
MPANPFRSKRLISSSPLVFFLQRSHSEQSQINYAGLWESLPLSTPGKQCCPRQLSPPTVLHFLLSICLRKHLLLLLLSLQIGISCVGSGTAEQDDCIETNAKCSTIGSGSGAGVVGGWGSNFWCWVAGLICMSVSLSAEELWISREISHYAQKTL